MKSPLLAPVRAMLVTVSVLLPVFVSVTVCAMDELPTLVDGKVRLVAESAALAETSPVPLREMV